jgi:hypothetical protein
MRKHGDNDLCLWFEDFAPASGLIVRKRLATDKQWEAEIPATAGTHKFINKTKSCCVPETGWESVAPFFVGALTYEEL